MNKAERHDIARESLLLRSLPSPVTDRLLSDATFREITRGETVFLQGERAQVIHVVLDGWVKLYRVSANGNEAVVDVFTRGHSFGEAVAFRQQPYPVSAEAVSDCALMLIPARSFNTILEQEPELSLAVIASTFQRLHELVAQVEQIKAQTGAQRVADFLLRLCNCQTGPCEVTLPYDKALIAGRLGMKPESLSRAFSKLKVVGVCVSRHHAKIDDIKLLQEYAEKDPADSWSKSL
ncbi:MAG: Crp/Fnr family transcriptional regulator [Roseovarius sp.]|jgi:CRP-like cAMP-binding protein|nr:Crp/Fnr family transcriptional regulator [Roseovarius sp.]